MTTNQDNKNNNTASNVTLSIETKSTDSNSKQSLISNWRIQLALLLLISTLIFVIFYLPNSITSPEIETDAKVFIAEEINKPIDDSPWHEAQLAKYRRNAQEILSLVLEKQNMLEQKKVSIWANEQYNSALDIANEGDLLYRNQEFEKALNNYQLTLDKLTEIERKIPEQLNYYLNLGIKALENYQAELAMENLKTAMYLQPENTHVQENYDRALVLDKILKLIKEGTILQEEKQLAAAQEKYQLAYDLDPMTKIAEEKLQQINKMIDKKEYSLAMSGGYKHLKNAQYDQAIKLFKLAQKKQPETKDPISALEQTYNEKKQASVSSFVQQAQAFELAQNWHDAQIYFKKALEKDPNLVLAKVGELRTQARANLDDKMQNIIDQPHRLSDKSVYKEAKNTYINATKINNPGSKLEQQILQVTDILNLTLIPVDIQIESDNLTHIKIYKVGDLGQFIDKTLSLKPGEYTIVGTRSGYRDVRQQVILAAGSKGQTIEVKCNEKITNG